MTTVRRSEAFKPAFTLLEEMTGVASSDQRMAIYTEHFLRNHLSVDAIYESVRKMLLSWEKRSWPSPEQIALAARNYQHTTLKSDNYDWRSFHAVFEMAAIERNDRRVEKANTWREANQQRFTKEIVPDVDRDVAHRMVRIKWLRQEKSYRQAFREGAIVQQCNNEVGKEARALERRTDAERSARAQRFGATGHVPDAR
jgi:hypothetical protein